MPSGFIHRPGEGGRHVVVRGRRCVDEAWADHGDFDAVRSQIAAQGLEQVTQAGFRSAIGFGPGQRQIGCRAGHSHHMRRSSGSQQGHGSFDAITAGEQVGAYDVLDD
ncbi:hypothetical protein D3C87_1560790 [compost metagenome]